jgi:molybdopterin converting factor small subunit
VKVWDSSNNKICIRCKLSYQIIDGYWKTPRALLCLDCKPKALKEAQRKHRASHKEAISKTTKIYRENNKDKIREHKKIYKQNNKDKVKADRDRHYSNQKNREKKSEQDRKYREANGKKIRAKKREWAKTQPLYLLRMKVSHLIRQHLKSHNGSKNGESSFSNVGSSVEDLRNHLESKFEPWMNWDNHGVYRKASWDDNDPSTWKWQIDHIIPHFSFHYDSMKHPDFKKCWALDNLRPLSAKKNLLKGKRKENV